MLTWCTTKDMLILAAAYVLLRMMRPFWQMQSAPEGVHTIGHHLPTRDGKGRIKG